MAWPVFCTSVFFVTLNVMAGNLLLAGVMSGPGRFGETLPPPQPIYPELGSIATIRQRWDHQSSTATPSTPYAFLIDPGFDPLFPIHRMLLAALWRNGRSIAGRRTRGKLFTWSAGGKKEEQSDRWATLVSPPPSSDCQQGG